MAFKSGGGMEAMRLNSVNYLGIGTNNPLTMLHVSGDATVTGNLSVNGSIITAPVASKFAMVTLSSIQTTISNGGQQFLFSDVVQNTFGTWDSINYRITVPYAGYVEVTVCLTIDTSTLNLTPYVVKNNLAVGTGTKIFDQAFNIGVGLARTGTTVIQCAAGDTLVIRSLSVVNLKTTNGSYVYYKML